MKKYYDWEKIAKKKIGECNFVLFFYDNEAILNSKDIRNIKWELNLAKKFKRKIITIYSKNNFEIKEYLKTYNLDNNIINDNEDVASQLFGYDYSENNINDKNYKNFDFKKGKEIVLEYANWSTENLFTTNNFDDNIELKKNTMIYY